MLIKSFPAGPWQTNCYVVSPGNSQECVIVDPGFESAGMVQEIVERANLKPIAVLLTHGHLDHMWSVFPIASGYEIPAMIHQKDRHLLTNPGAGVSQETIEMMQQSFGLDNQFIEPSEVIEIEDMQSFTLAGINFTVNHAPGHTAGSLLFGITDEQPILFTGDVLFAGAIGRVDLPGGSAEAMNQSLRTKIMNLTDDTLVYPGHGPSTTMEQERVTNPYLLRIAQGLNAV